jgi:hypothetical protein
VDGQHEQGLQALALTGFQEAAGLLRRERADLFLDLRHPHALGGVAGDEAVLHRLL